MLVPLSSSRVNSCAPRAAAMSRDDCKNLKLLLVPYFKFDNGVGLAPSNPRSLEEEKSVLSLPKLKNFIKGIAPELYKRICPAKDDTALLDFINDWLGEHPASRTSHVAKRYYGVTLSPAMPAPFDPAVFAAVPFDSRLATALRAAAYEEAAVVGRVVQLQAAMRRMRVAGVSHLMH